MTALTRDQQLVLEDINRARLNPAGELAHLGFGLNEGVAADRQISATAKQVLAPSVALTNAAQGHSNVLSQNKGVFDNTAPLFTNNNPNQGLTVHTGLGDGTPGSRISASGYVDTRNSGFIQNESVSLAWNSGTLTAQDSERILHERSNFLATDHSLQNGVDQAIDGRGHRTALFQEDIREVGIGVARSTLPIFGFSASTVSVTENFGRSGNTVFLTGAAYDDGKNNIANHTYGDGSARQGITVTVDGSGSDITGSGGGWSVGGIGGVHTVKFSGGGLAAPVSVTVDAGQANAKVDLVNGREIDVSANATLGAGAVDLRLLGVANLNGTGNAGNNNLIGNHGNNLLDGGAGDDTAVYSGRSTDYQVAKLADGSFQIVDLRAGSLDGTDVLKNIEHIQFLGDNTIKNLVAAPPPPPAITGTDAGETLRGTSGADVILALGGDDTLIGGAGADRLDGGAGFDTASYATSSAAISINLATGINHGGDAEGDTLISIERVIGSA